MQKYSTDFYKIWWKRGSSATEETARTFYFISHVHCLVAVCQPLLNEKALRETQTLRARRSPPTDAQSLR